MHFVAGYQRGRHAGHAVARRFLVADAAPGRAKGVGSDAPNIGDDWALVIPEERLPLAGLDTVLLVPDDPLAETRIEATRAGYSRNRPHVLSGVDRRQAWAVPGRPALFFHSCDAAYGDSGSLAFIWRNGVTAMLGIHVGVAHPGAQPVGVGVRPTAFADPVVALLCGTGGRPTTAAAGYPRLSSGT